VAGEIWNRPVLFFGIFVYFFCLFFVFYFIVLSTFVVNAQLDGWTEWLVLHRTVLHRTIIGSLVYFNEKGKYMSQLILCEQL